MTTKDALSDCRQTRNICSYRWVGCYAGYATHHVFAKINSSNSARSSTEAVYERHSVRG